MDDVQKSRINFFDFVATKIFFRDIIIFSIQVAGIPSLSIMLELQKVKAQRDNLSRENFQFLRQTGFHTKRFEE